MNIKDKVLSLSRIPMLGVLDADALAALLIGEITADSNLSPQIRGALIDTAAILVRHSRDAESAADQTARLLDRMTRSGDAYAK